MLSLGPPKWIETGSGVAVQSWWNANSLFTDLLADIPELLTTSPTELHFSPCPLCDRLKYRDFAAEIHSAKSVGGGPYARVQNTEGYLVRYLAPRDLLMFSECRITSNYILLSDPR